MKTKTTITEITHEDLVNLLSTATYGSSWVSCTVSGLTHNAVKSDGDCREDIWANALLAGHPIYLTDEQAEGCTYGGKTLCVNEDESVTYRIELDDVKQGIADALDGNFAPGDEDEREWAAKCAIHLADESTEFDADEADALMQIIMFGSLIYA